MMKVQSIRLPDRLWDDVQSDALRDGVSASEWIREAIVFRQGYEQSRADLTAELANLRPNRERKR